MQPFRFTAILVAIALVGVLLFNCSNPNAAIERPIPVVSKRVVIFDDSTYVRLTELWKKYNDAFPSEEAYGNWMKAARYARDKGYDQLLEEGLKKYPSNPTLLYLTALVKANDADNAAKAIELFEKAVQFDPSYLDPWFGLVTNYMIRGDREKTDMALRRLYEGNAVTEEIMDYNYNLLTLLEPNAILITNGDNDTYPSWILTRIVKHRPDVIIANRSLLNAKWYSQWLINEGAPAFVTSQELTSIEESRMKDLQSGKEKFDGVGFISDTLIVRIIEAAKKAGRPVYFAATVGPNPKLDAIRAQGSFIGLGTLVTASKTSKADGDKLLAKWVNEFRTGGIDSWRLHTAKSSDAGRMITKNYPYGICKIIEAYPKVSSKMKKQTFDWYTRHADWMLSPDERKGTCPAWKPWDDVSEIKAWLKQQNCQ